MSRTFGVDVSHWNGLINWQKMDVNFAIFKCSDGYTIRDTNKNVDPMYLTNVSNFKQAKGDMLSGAYHFARFDTNSSWCMPLEEQAQLLVEQASGNVEFMVMDIEQHYKRLTAYSRSNIVNKVLHLLDLTSSLSNKKLLIYTGPWWWNYYFNSNYNVL